MEEMRLLAPTAILGYGFPLESFKRGMEANPHVIGVDAGSTDPGPYYLGKGKSFTDRTAVKRDLRIILEAASAAGIPVVIGSAGGSGGLVHVDWNEAIVEELASELNLSFKLARIDAEFSQEYVLDKLNRGEITPLPGCPVLNEEDVRQSVRIVGQMGIEPVQKALAAGAQVIVAGRAYDPVCFAALPVMKGFDPGLALHLGKILECAAIAATPGSGRDCMLGILRKDHFLIRPTNKTRRCTTESVAAHSLYEKSDPFHLHGPGGSLDLTGTRYTQVDEETVKVTGTRFVEAPYSIKLEAARKTGYRAVSIAGTRDPVMIEKIEEIITGVKDNVNDNFNLDGRFFLHFHLYGYRGVMGELEPVRSKAHELGIVMEAVAPSQEEANTILSFARSTMLHYGYPGRISTAGNLAFPYSPSDFEAGEVFEFSIYHLLQNIDPVSPFKIKYEEIGGLG
ncbi:MAG: acyclic terpene utilization AtuA family protein [Dethiobacter sp.]|jgi:hypothetical protein|nr:acyclic terpene utilization AtuA family protein [Dethiobacter sp.]